MQYDAKTIREWTGRDVEEEARKRKAEELKRWRGMAAARPGAFSFLLTVCAVAGVAFACALII